MPQAHQTITTDEMKDFEQILANLLEGASKHEQDSILLIHKRLKFIFEAQKSNRESLDYLQSLRLK